MKLLSVLIVDDEERIVNFLRSKLKASGYEVFTARNGLEAVGLVRSEEPGIVLLDLIMPQMDGLEALKEIRSFSAVPIIILTAKDTDNDKIRGLQLGADDYLAKPFNPDEVVARIEAMRRRLEPAERRKTMDTISLGNVTIDFKKYQVVIEGEEQYLTRIEWLLLSELARSAGRFMTYEELLGRIWGPEYRDDVQLLRTWISRLRGKLEKPPRSLKIIRTIPKVGYIIDKPDS
ncbi:MAG: response regulator transcription factor [Dehalococcoidales bacterium]|nr:response regulator transcription factor [Dehalococcoidales bacterium]